MSLHCSCRRWYWFGQTWVTVQIIVVKICSEWVRSHTWKTCPVWWKEVIIFKQTLGPKQPSTNSCAYATGKKRIAIKRTKPSATKSWWSFLLLIFVAEKPFEEVIIERIFFKKVSENVFSMMEVKIRSSERWIARTSRWLRAIVAIEIVGLPFVFIG